MKPAIRWMVLFVALVLAPGCVLMRGSAPAPPPARPSVDVSTLEGVVFCADGAGGYGYTTEALEYVLTEARAPLYVERVDWSHGRGRMTIDNCHWSNIREHATRLAARVGAVRTRYPHLRVYLVSHSAGSAVILEAARELPPGSVERIVVLAPSVSPSYDLRVPLVTSRQGIDAYTSQSDWFTLGLGMRVFGTTDRRWTAAAGKVGFRRPAPNTPEAALYARLREHPWDQEQAATGHKGGHYGSYAPGFLRAQVLPLLTR